MTVCREFIKIQDVGQEQIPADYRFQAASCVISLVLSFFFLFWKKDQNIRLKTSSWDERFSDTFRLRCRLIVRAICINGYIHSLWCCIILLCHCPALQNPRDSNWNRVTAILTLRLSNPCATIMRQLDDINIRIFEFTLVLVTKLNLTRSFCPLTFTRKMTRDWEKIIEIVRQMDMIILIILWW